MTRIGLRGTIGLAVTVALAVAACGGDDDLQRDTQLRQALSEVGTAVSPTGSGFGWLDVERVRRESGTAALIADAGALGPGGDQLFEEARRVARGTRIDPLAADQALSVSASYTFAIRLDGISPGRLPAELRRAGARRKGLGNATAFDLGETPQAVLTGPLSPLDALASRTAVGDDFVVMSRFDGPRAALAGDGEPVLENEWLDFATACLGEVWAARTFPGGFAHNPPATPDLLAVGARPTSA